MNADKLTVKSQEALAAAQRLARDRNHAQIEDAHLLAALLGQADGVVFPLLQKMEAQPRSLRTAAEATQGRPPRQGLEPTPAVNI